MLHQTSGVVLRTIKYGDTSIIVSIYTEKFGIQSYLVNGVRTEKRSGNKANLYQPATLLDLIVYHHPNKNLQRIKEARVLHLYQHVQSSMVRNAIAIYMVELISKTISEPECNPELFDFFLQSFLYVDGSPGKNLADFPLQFTIDHASHLGFAIQAPEFNSTDCVFDLQNGQFIPLNQLRHTHFADQELSQVLIDYLLQDESLKLNHFKRQHLLTLLIQYLQLHIPQMRELKSPEVLHAIMA